MSARKEPPVAAVNWPSARQPPQRSQLDGQPQGARLSWPLLKCALTNWFNDEPSTTGAAIAFYCVFSLAPLLVILLAISGQLLGEAAAQRQLTAQLDALFGSSTATALLNAATSARQARGLLATVVSAVALLIGATTVLAALEGALRRIWQSKVAAAAGIGGWFRTRLLSFGIILALGFLLLVSLTISTALSSVQDMLATRYPVVVPALSAVNLLVSLSLVAGLFSLVYGVLPARRLSWRPIASGALITAVLFDLGRRCIGLYLSHSIEPTAFGAAASFAALLLWLYYSAQIFLFGAQLTACLGGLRESTPAGA